VTERPDLLENPLYADRWIRTENQIVVLAETAEIMKTRPTAEWAKRLSKVGLMVGPVLSLQEAADNEQVKARDTIMTIKHAKGGDLPIIRNAIRMKNNPITEYRSPPILGAHADEVLSGVMGLSEQEITELRVQGVIGPLLK
jgi:crotonobetainyl-CoA:carnitine CoA-transferase CaiB-like acyl-CoA transferase